MDDYKRILSFLKKQRLTRFFRSFIDMASLCAGALFLTSAILAVLFQLLPWTGIIIFFDLSLVLIVAVFLFLTVKKLVKLPSLVETAALLENESGKRHNTLSLAVQLKQNPVKGESEDLIGSTVHQASLVLDNYMLKDKYPGLKNFLFCLLSGSMFITAALNASPSILSYWDLPFVYNRDSKRIISPGNVEIAQGKTVTLTCRTLKRRYPSTLLKIEHLKNNKSETRLLKPDKEGLFVYTVDSVTGSFRYLFSAGNSADNYDTVKVVPPPDLLRLSISLDPPGYTGKPVRDLPEGNGNITCYPGTKAGILIQSHYPLDSASLILSKNDTLAMKVNEKSAEIETRLWKSGGYSFLMQDTLLQLSRDLPRYYINMLPDYDPVVRFIKPGYNVDLKPSQQETLFVESVDDLGIRRLRLKWRKNTGDSIHLEDLLTKSDHGLKTVQKEISWDLTELSLYPGDTVYYWAEAEDTWPYKNPHTASSDTFWFRIPSFNEIHKQMAEKEQESEEIFKNVKKSQNSLSKRLENFIRSTKGKDSLSWEEKKIVQDMEKSVNRQIDSLRDAVSSLKNAMEHIKNREIIKDKMDEIQKAVDDIIKEYGENILYDKQNKSDDLSWNDIKDNIDKIKKVLPKIEEYLENTLKYLQMLKRDRELASLASQANELSRKQLEAVETESTDALKKLESRLLKEIGDLLENVKGVSQNPKDPLGDFQNAGEAMDLKNSMSSDISQNNIPQLSDMISMSSRLNSLSQELNNMMSSSMMKQLLEDKNRLKRMAIYTLETAGWQKEIEQSVSKSKNDRESTAASQQAVLDALKDTRVPLDSIIMLPPSIMQNILEDLKNAENSIKSTLENFNSPYVDDKMGKAGSDIRRLTISILAAADSLSQAGGNSGQQQAGGGLMPGLQKLSGKQAAVNSITSSLFKNMLDGQGRPSKQGGQGPGLSLEEKEQARKAQQKIADQLKKLAEKYKNSENRSTLDNVKKLEEEAGKLARMIEGSDPGVKKKQDRFLVRMLQSALSVHDQDKGKKKRVSRSAKKVFSKTTVRPDKDLDLSREDTFYRLRRKAMDGNYPEEYRFGVQNYFDSLGVLFLNN